MSLPQTLVVVTRHHGRFYAPALADLPPRALVIQPGNRGTAPAILYALLRVARTAPRGPVAIFPSDHYVSDDQGFMAHVDGAFRAVEARPDLVVLLGIMPDCPEVEYGWIEPEAPVAGLGPLSGAVHSYHAFSVVGAVLGTPKEPEAVRMLYERLVGADFSRQVLAARPTGLAVLPVAGIGWNDLGNPRRVLATRRRAREHTLAVG